MRHDSEMSMTSLAKLYEALKTRYYWFSDDEEIRRMDMDEEFLEPYKLLGSEVEKVAYMLGDRDVI